MAMGYLWSSLDVTKTTRYISATLYPKFMLRVVPDSCNSMKHGYFKSPYCKARSPLGLNHMFVVLHMICSSTQANSSLFFPGLNSLKAPKVNGCFVLVFYLFIYFFLWRPQCLPHSEKKGWRMICDWGRWLCSPICFFLIWWSNFLRKGTFSKHVSACAVPCQLHLGPEPQSKSVQSWAREIETNQ